jgi:hypothetical protein
LFAAPPPRASQSAHVVKQQWRMHRVGHARPRSHQGSGARGRSLAPSKLNHARYANGTCKEESKIACRYMRVCCIWINCRPDLACMRRHDYKHREDSSPNLHHSRCLEAIYIDCEIRYALHQAGLYRSEHMTSSCTTTSSYEQDLCRVLNRQHKYRQGLHQRGLSPPPTKTPSPS